MGSCGISSKAMEYIDPDSDNSITHFDCLGFSGLHSILPDAIKLISCVIYCTEQGQSMTPQAAIVVG
jgi:hypothetical protein